MILVIKGKVPALPCLVNTFEEEYDMYLKRTGKKWRTQEGFSLDFDSTLEDLKKCHFVHTNDEKLIKLLRQKLNVIE